MNYNNPAFTASPSPIGPAQPVSGNNEQPYDPRERGQYPLMPDQFPRWPNNCCFIIAIILFLFGVGSILTNILGIVSYEATTADWYIGIVAGIIYLITCCSAAAAGALVKPTNESNYCIVAIFVSLCAVSAGLAALAGIIIGIIGMVKDNWPLYVYYNTGVNPSTTTIVILEARLIINAAAFAIHVLALFIGIAGASLGCRDSCCASTKDPYSDFARLGDRDLDPYSDSTRAMAASQRKTSMGGWVSGTHNRGAPNMGGMPRPGYSGVSSMNGVRY